MSRTASRSAAAAAVAKVRLRKRGAGGGSRKRSAAAAGRRRRGGGGAAGSSHGPSALHSGPRARGRGRRHAAAEPAQRAGALKRSLSTEQVRADFITLGLSEEKATYFSEKWKQSAPSLVRWAMGQTLMINQLVDMEWRFGVTSGSSELEKVGSIFLQLKLVVKKGHQTENLYIELTLPQFYSFLHEMERVKSSMECLS